MDGFAGLLKRQLNNILTGLLLIAAVFLFIRWRMRVAETEKQTISGYLGNAREELVKLESGSFIESYDKQTPGKIDTLRPADAVKAAQVREIDIEKYISDVLNSSSIDEPLKLQALQLRGDLYWTLGNFPLSAESATRADERMTETPEAFLTKAATAYTEIASADHSKYPELVDGAKINLADIAVDRAQWADAQKMYQEVADDATGPGFQRDLARAKIAGLPALKNPSTLVVATTAPIEPPAAVISPAPPTIPPVYGPTISAIPTTTLPAMPTTTMPAK